MSLYVLDSDCFFLLLQGHHNLVRRAISLPPDRIAVTAISFEEQLYARWNRIQVANTPEELAIADEKLQQTFAYFSCMNLLDFTRNAYECYIQLLRQRLLVPTQCLRIAAVVLSARGIVVTRDRDFEKIPGLQWEDWTLD